ncbi:MAG: hypothetical protein IKZ53_07680 [Selenomonadaceae bacterium]|nr:hypothetical protein [Selenomonadaceae bacterium]
MFDDFARIDDIIDFFKKPTSDDEEEKKTDRLAESGLRINSRKDFGDDNMQFDFSRQMNSGVLK